MFQIVFRSFSARALLFLVFVSVAIGTPASAQVGPAGGILIDLSEARRWPDARGCRTLSFGVEQSGATLGNDLRQDINRIAGLTVDETLVVSVDTNVEGPVERLSSNLLTADGGPSALGQLLVAVDYELADWIQHGGFPDLFGRDKWRPSVILGNIVGDDPLILNALAGMDTLKFPSLRPALVLRPHFNGCVLELDRYLVVRLSAGYGEVARSKFGGIISRTFGAVDAKMAQGEREFLAKWYQEIEGIRTAEIASLVLMCRRLRFKDCDDSISSGTRTVGRSPLERVLRLTSENALDRVIADGRRSK